jgi:hypothetical protein
MLSNIFNIFMCLYNLPFVLGGSFVIIFLSVQLDTLIWKNSLAMIVLCQNLDSRTSVESKYY